MKIISLCGNVGNGLGMNLVSQPTQAIGLTSSRIPSPLGRRRDVALNYPSSNIPPCQFTANVYNSDWLKPCHPTCCSLFKQKNHTEEKSRPGRPQIDRNPQIAVKSITVASSASPSLTRRKPSSSASSSTEPGRVVGRVTIPSRASEPQFPFWQQTWFIALLLAMAMGFLCLAVFLFLGLDLDTGYAATTPTSEGVEITYGTVLKLMHERTKFRLHSHDVPYGSGSGQQSVTGFPNVDDANSYWIVRPQLETSARQGDSIPSGTIVRFQHMKTRKWLHSHLHASPISGNQEISCFGGEHESDTGDHWRVMIEGSGKTWKQDQRVRLQHVDTGAYLHSHDKKYQRIAGGQQEVCGVRDKRADNVWLAAEGVYLPVTETK